MDLKEVCFMKSITVDKINSMAENKPCEFIEKCENEFYKKIDRIAEKILKEEIKYIFLTGPSSSGKTTFSSILLKRLSSKKTFDISLDNYYKLKKEMPRRKNNDYNFETIKSLKVDDMKKDFLMLKNGEEVLIPIIDFASDDRKEKREKVQVTDNTVVLIEGIHALNSKITNLFKDEKILKIFIMPEPVIKVGESYISKYDLRFVRRMVRDYYYRYSDVFNSFKLWKYVRLGEVQFMANYKKRADIIENTYLDYETCVLKKHALKQLYKVGKDSIHYIKARRIINFLEKFSDLDDALVPKNSLLKEFIK